MEEAEQEIDELKKDNSELILKNATLTAENNLLTKQIAFLEKMVMKVNNNVLLKDDSCLSFTENQYENNTEFVLPIHKKDNNDIEDSGHELRYDNPNYNLGIFRTVPQHTFRKHVMMLGIVTLLLCVSFISFDTSGIVDNQNEFAVRQFKNNLDIALKSINTSTSDGLTKVEQLNFESLLFKLLTNDEEYNNMKIIIKYLFIVGYCLYFIYICLIANWRFILRNKLKEF